MSINITRDQIDTLWDQGYRPYEIYTTNAEPVDYCGERMPAGAVGGWDIKHVFAKRSVLEAEYPFFDAVIAVSAVACCDEIFHGK